MCIYIHITHINIYTHTHAYVYIHICAAALLLVRSPLPKQKLKAHRPPPSWSAGRCRKRLGPAAPGTCAPKLITGSSGGGPAKVTKALSNLIPGPQTYVEGWPSALCLDAFGHNFTRFLCPSSKFCGEGHFAFVTLLLRKPQLSVSVVFKGPQTVHRRLATLCSSGAKPRLGLGSRR